MAKPTLDDRLTVLWNQRGALNEADNTELYWIIRELLHCRYPQLPYKGLPDSLDDYIHAFFIQKVLASRSGVTEREVSRQHLVGFFNNFLKDQLKKDRRQRVFVENDPIMDADGEAMDRDYEDPHAFDFSPDQVEEVLAQYQLTRRQLTESAQYFYGALQEWQQQVLTRGLCPDSEYAMPLSQLQEQFPKTATYYKAKQLGVVHSLRTLPTDYKKTEIGRWLTTQLKLPLEQDNYTILQIALQVLCLVALQALDD